MKHQITGKGPVVFSSSCVSLFLYLSLLRVLAGHLWLQRVHLEPVGVQIDDDSFLISWLLFCLSSAQVFSLLRAPSSGFVSSRICVER